jgi:RimJ/RimL family protein N-acetyltransferase
MRLVLRRQTISLRAAEIRDAKFILNLRLKKGEFLSDTNTNLDWQKDWIRAYKKREYNQEEYYFIIENKYGLSVGTVRIYNINHKDKSFTFGSFIVDHDFAHKHSAFEAMNLVLNFAFDQLYLKSCLFDCRKNNDQANNFYLRFGAKIIHEDDVDYFFKISIDDYQISKIKYKKFLADN